MGAKLPVMENQYVLLVISGLRKMIMEARPNGANIPQSIETELARLENDVMDEKGDGEIPDRCVYLTSRIMCASRYFP